MIESAQAPDRVVLRTQKAWEIFSIGIGAAISFLPGVIVVLIFESRMPLRAAIVLWLLSTVVLLDHWWWAEEIFRKFPNDSRLIAWVTLGYLISLLSLPAVLLGARVDQLRALNYYGEMLVVLSVFDILFCVIYARLIWKTHSADRDGFIRPILIDGIAIFVFLFWLTYALPSESGMLSKAVWLALAYMLFVMFEFLTDLTFKWAISRVQKPS